MVGRIVSAAVFCAVAALGFAGGDLGGKRPDNPVPNTSKFGGTIPQSRIGPPGGANIQKDAPLPAPERRIGWGFNCHEFYGPTYYYPSYHNTYEGLHPQYYPFYHPRLWPNYKTDAMYCKGKQCGASRSGYYWDGYDDWMRGGRYEQHQ